MTGKILEEIGNRLLPMPYALANVDMPHDRRDITQGAIYFEVRANLGGKMLFSAFTLLPTDGEIDFSRKLRHAYLTCKSAMVRNP